MEQITSRIPLPDTYSYCHVQSKIGEDIFRIKEVTNSIEAVNWIRLMSNTTRTTWRVSRTYPYSGAHEFRKDFRCQHFTDKRYCGTRSTKNTYCPALMKILIKKSQTQNGEDDQLLREYPTEVILRGEHNHGAESLRYRVMSSETKRKLYSLYNFGYSPAAALQMLRMELVFENSQDFDQVSIDGQCLPSHSVVSKLFKNDFQSFDDSKMFLYLEDFLSDVRNNSGSRCELRKTFDGDHYFIVFVSSLMVRCHVQMKQCSELVYLDVVHTDRHVVYLFVTPSAAGSLPLGVVIVDCWEDKLFLEALKCYKNLLSNSAFFSTGCPKIFMTDHNLSVKTCLQTVFPNCSLLSNQLQLLKSFWLWLGSKSSGVKTHHQNGLYSLFRKVVYSLQVDEADVNAAKLISTAKTLCYRKLVVYFELLWEQRKEWVTCFREGLLVSGNNYFEIVLRGLNSVIFANTASYRLLQLVHFIVTKYEMFMKQKIVEFCVGVANSSTVLLRLMQEDIDLTLFSVTNYTDYEVFNVSCVEGGSFMVDMIRDSCTCSIWSARKRCVHMIVVFLNLESTSTVAADIDTKHGMLYVCEGIEVDWAKSDSLEESSERFQGTDVDESSSQAGVLPDSVHLPSKTNISEDAILDVRLEFNNFIDRIKNGLSSNPNAFLPALRQMLRNARTSTSTDIGLLSAMCSFGLNAATRSSTRKAANDTFTKEIAVIKNRQHQLTGKRNLEVSRQTIEAKVIKIKSFKTIL